MPLKEKVCKFSVCTDETVGGRQIGEVKFNMADFNYGGYKAHRLYLQPIEGKFTEYKFDQNETYIDIGIKGTKVEENKEQYEDNYLEVQQTMGHKSKSHGF